jgi:hypothetical protein
MSLQGGNAAMFIYPEDIDKHFNWQPGTAARLARRQKLPHYRLPDGSIRFKLDELEALVKRVEMPLHPEGAAANA